MTDCKKEEFLVDLDIRNKNAIVCASSKGLGKACAVALAREGVNVIVNGRDPQTLAEAVAEVEKLATGSVASVVADVTTENGRNALLAACPEPDILVNNAGGPPPGDFREWELEQWNAALNANMLTPIMLIKATVDGMRARGFGRIVNITSAAVKAPIPTLGLSNGARAGLTGFVAGLARQVAADGVTINGILPGPFETDRLKTTIMGRAEKSGLTLEDQLDIERKKNPSARFGFPEEFGELCAFLCSAHTGYLTGQNIVIDGGNFQGTL